MWDHLPVMNLVALQRIAAIKSLERAISAGHREGFDTDELLEEHSRLLAQLRAGPVA